MESKPGGFQTNVNEIMALKMLLFFAYAVAAFGG